MGFDSIKKQKRWVLWNLEEVGGRNTKVPYTIRGKRASSTNPADWSTYADAKKALANFGSGIGIIFTPAQDLIGIDIDHVIEKGKLVGEHAAAIKKLIAQAGTYTEVSPSGTGLHLYIATDPAFVLQGNRHAPFEAYASGRFFTFTEKSFGKRRDIRHADHAEVETILATIGYPWKASVSESTASAASLLDGPRFTDEELLQRMFGSKNGETIKALYDGDMKAYADDASRADAALLNHLAFWSGKQKDQMERVWMASPLGKRKKTIERKDYRDRSIKQAIASCKEVFRTNYERIVDEFHIDFLFTLDSKKDKVITQNVENIVRILRHHPEFAGTFRKDEFAGMLEIRDKGVWRQFEDVDAIHIQARISIIFDFFQKVGKDMVYDAILKIFDENAYDSAVDFITGLSWDGTKRLDDWLHHAYGAPKDEYHAAVASNWLKGLVKRVMQPGCKFDYVLVLEGEQGAKKSTSLYILGEMPNGRNGHIETTMGVDSKDFFMQMKGKFIMEFSEGETLSRTEVKKMKAIITTQVDKFREPYARVSVDHPRRCVFAMTTNQDQYLKDETGNRRWLPVRVVLEKANVEWLAANRDQIVAEARVRVEAGETLYEFPEEATREHQDARRISSPNEEKIVEWYMNDPYITRLNKDEGITIEQVWRGALSGFGPLKKFDEMDIADVLKRVLKLTKKRVMVDGIQSTRWVNERVLDLAAVEA